MKEFLYFVLICLAIIGGVYLIGRILVRAGLHEVDSYLNKKFYKHTKLKKDDSKKDE